MRYHLERAFSGKGPEPQNFKESLRGLALDSGHIYAVGDSEVKVFNKSCQFLRRWSTSQPGSSVAVSLEKVYVGEAGQLEIFDHHGKLLDAWKDTQRLGLVTAIELFREHVLIADSRDRCIRRYDQQGNFINNIGKDNRMGGFRLPNAFLDFSVDENGIIHACNPGKHRVERYTMEDELLGHIGRFDGRNPEGFTGCCNPTNVAVSRQGHTYVTEKAGPRAKVLDAGGNLLAVIATDAFDLASKNMDLVVDSDGRVFVADTVRLQINIFTPQEVSTT